MKFRKDDFQHADQVPFDDSNVCLEADDVQEALENLYCKVDVSASPGFTWGKSGAVKNSWLLNDTVPSNLAGRVVPIDGQIVEITATAEVNSLGIIKIYKPIAEYF